MDKLKQELERRGHGAKGMLAAHLGIRPSAMSKKLNGSLSISAGEAARIAEWLGQPVTPETRPSPPSPVPSSARRTAQSLTPLDLRRQDLPVWAAVQGGEEGAMLITTSPIDWIARPRELEVRDAFAVFLIGDSMSPRYDHGDQLYVHPHRPPKGGDDCLFIHEVEAEGQFLGLAKTLVRAGADKWRVRQYTPQKEFDLDRRKWTKAWKIVGKMNRM
jgi:phage repressor protein C with HTH and peptisase S24 domain